MHTNSGIPNHAYYEVVVRVGREKAQQIVWRALTEHLEPDSDFEDFRTAMIDSAEELYGRGTVSKPSTTPSPSSGSTALASARAGRVLK